MSIHRLTFCDTRIKVPIEYSNLWMQQTKKQIFELIKKFMSAEEFNNEIQQLNEEFDGLVEEDVLALYVADKKGGNLQGIHKIGDITDGSSITVLGKITNIGSSRQFNRKNGSAGRVINLEICDESGCCPLVLWGNDVNLVENGTIKKDSVVKIINGYVKHGFNGLEVNLGRWGMIEVDPEEVSVDTKKMTDNKPVASAVNEFTGVITGVDPTRSFFKDTGEFGFVTRVHVKDDKKTQTFVVWDEQVKTIQRFKVGDQVMIRNFSSRAVNGETELHINGASIIQTV